MGWIGTAHSHIVSGLRLGRGMVAKRSASEPPAKPLVLFEFEACPYCRKVREVMSELDLSYRCHPCARGSRHRAELIERAGKAQFPYLIDPNTGVEMYESEDITTYLLDTYGSGRTMASRAAGPLNSFGSGLASGISPWGRFARKTVRTRPSPDASLILYNFEASPYCRVVREELNALDLIHEVRNVAKGGARREELVALGGKMQVPFLSDPNTGSTLYESEDIVAYLRKTYGPIAQPEK